MSSTILPLSCPLPPMSSFTHKRIRRSATAVMAGIFDVRPPRDVLTSLLNGVAPYKAVEKDEVSRRNRRKEKRDRERQRKEQKAATVTAVVTRPKLKEAPHIPDPKSDAMIDSKPAASSSAPPRAQHPPTTAASSFWRARPAIHIATMQRSVSVTPPPISSPLPRASTSTSTPGPSCSSRTSSKRPRTPDDDELSLAPPSLPRPRKKRIAVKKGWKGWVEGSPKPSDKLINLDAVPVLHERRTRSGKNFDAIGVGKDSWV